MRLASILFILVFSLITLPFGMGEMMHSSPHHGQVATVVDHSGHMGSTQDDPDTKPNHLHFMVCSACLSLPSVNVSMAEETEPVAIYLRTFAYRLAGTALLPITPPPRA